MSDYDDSNSGVLFKNDKKGNDKAPDYKGKINVAGVEKQLAAWIKKSQKGVVYMSLAVSEPYQSDEAKTLMSEDLDEKYIKCSDVPF